MTFSFQVERVEVVAGGGSLQVDEGDRDPNQFTDVEAVVLGPSAIEHAADAGLTESLARLRDALRARLGRIH